MALRRTLAAQFVLLATVQLVHTAICEQWYRSLAGVCTFVEYATFVTAISTLGVFISNYVSQSSVQE